MADSAVEDGSNVPLPPAVSFQILCFLKRVKVNQAQPWWYAGWHGGRRALWWSWRNRASCQGAQGFHGQSWCSFIEVSSCQLLFSLSSFSRSLEPVPTAERGSGWMFLTCSRRLVSGSHLFLIIMTIMWPCTGGAMDMIVDQATADKINKRAAR